MARFAYVSSLVSVVLAACSGGGSGTTAPPGSGSPVEVVVDGFGVPHVYAQTDAGALYGMGWACARDRFFQMSYERLLIRGRLAEVFGTDPGDGSSAYLLNDFRMRLYGYGRLADRLEQGLDAATRALLQAYCDGINDYVAQASSLHPLFTTFGVPVEPWRPSDCVAAWMRLGRFISGNPQNEARKGHDYEDLIGMGKSPSEAAEDVLGIVFFDEPAAIVQQSDVPASVQADMQAYAQSLGIPSQAAASYRHDGPKFSQAWVVAGDRTTTSQTAVVADPRLPVRVPNVLWEVHAAGATFEFRGVCPPGSPNLLVGMTPQVAWGMTAQGMDQADVFLLETDPVGHPDEYFLDGQWVPFSVNEVEVVRVKGQADRTMPYRETVWGPVVTRFLGDSLVLNDVDPDEEFAWRWAPHVATDAVPFEALLAMVRARDVDEFGPALADLSYPPLHCVFGDENGRIGYWAVGTLPVRAQVDPGGPNLNPGIPLGGAGYFDGTTTQSEWLDIVPHHLKPWVLDPAAGWLAAANHLPVGSWYPIPLVHDGGHSWRSWRLYERVGHLFPTPASTATPDDVRDIHRDGGWPPARDVVRLGVHLRDAQQFAFSPEASSALALLEPWADSGLDGQLVMDVVHDGLLDAADPKASALALWTGRIPFRAKSSGGLVDDAIIATFGFGEAGYGAFLRAKVAGLLQVPPVDLTPEEADVIELSLSEGWKATLLAAGPESGWANWYTGEALTKDLTHWSSLEALPPLVSQPVPIGPVPVGWVDTLQSAFQQAYSRFGAIGAGAPPRVETLMPLGQAEDPASPHWDDQRAMWEASPQVLKSEPFDRALLPQPVTVFQLDP